MAKCKYKITNYGNTRTIYVAGDSWEISKHSTIETDNKEVADAFEKLMFIDVEAVEQPRKKTTKISKKKKLRLKRKHSGTYTTVSKNKKRKVTTRFRKKIKRRKN